MSKNEYEKEERAIWSDLFTKHVVSKIPLDKAQQLLNRFGDIETGPETAEELQRFALEATGMNDDDAASMAAQLTFEFAAYLSPNRVLALRDAGSAAEAVSVDTILEKAATGQYVYFQSIEDRPNFGDWLTALELSFFSPENPNKNDYFEMYVASLPTHQPFEPTVGKMPDVVHYITAGVPIAFKHTALALASEFNLEIGQEGCGFAIADIGPNARASLQYDPDSMSRLHEILSGLQVTTLMGPGIFQVTNVGGRYFNASEYESDS